jgi:hypothetical protein
MSARNWSETHWLVRSTRGGGRPKSGEGGIASPVRQCLGASLEKLHGFTGERFRGLGEARVQQKGGWPRWPSLGRDGGRRCSLLTANSGDPWLGRGSGCAVPTAEAFGHIYRRGHGTGARGEATTRGARAAAASPRSAGQASDRTRGHLLLPEFKRP